MTPPDSTVHDSLPHDFIDAEFAIAGLENPADEQKLSAALSGLHGVKSLTVAQGKVAAEYDPLRVTKAEIEAEIQRAGFVVAEVESAQASPISDALHEGQPPAAQ